MKKHPALASTVGLIVLLTAALLLSGASVLTHPGTSFAMGKKARNFKRAAVRSFIYGYPLIMTGITENVVTNVHDATSVPGRAPKNQFANATVLSNATYTDVVLPNVNTLYSMTFLDLSKEPIILHLPDMTGRFFLMESLDAWTNVIDNSPGTRSNTQEGNYAYVGPNFAGTLPAGITQVFHFPTNLVWIIGRTYVDGSQQDIDYVVNNLQSEYTLTPLSSFGQPYTPPDNSPLNPTIDMLTPPFQQVANMDACAFFGTLAAMLQLNPPLPQDTRAVARLAKIGVVPGQAFDCSTLSSKKLAKLQRAVQEGNAIVNAASHHTAPTGTGWNMDLKLGEYGRAYILRAAVARAGLGANYYKDAVYAASFQDYPNGDTLNGANQYTLHFDAGELPPANAQAFWSVTLYNAGLENLYANSINRNALGIPAVQDHLPCYNDDNSITFYIQNTQPVPTQDDPNNLCNWLPAPSGDFLLLMRIYWPGQTLFDGQWLPPGVEKSNQ